MELIERNGKVRIKQDTVEDRIAAVMVGELAENELTAEEHRMMERWEQLWSLLNNYHSTTQAVKAHLSKCEQAGHPISRATAYRDLDRATKLWGDASKVKKQTQLVLLNEYAMKILQLATKAHNYSEMNKALANLVKITAQQEEFFDHTPEPHTYLVQINNAAGVTQTLDVDQLHTLPIEEHESVMDAVESREITVEQMSAIIDGE